MQAHLDAMIVIFGALIDGDLDLAKTQARWIVENDMDPRIESWRPYAQEIHAWAGDIVDASAIEPAAAAGAELARTCGRCHAGHEVPPDLGAVPPPPADSPQRISHMQRHQWAAERMYEGLIGPSEERWTAGVRELADAPLTSEEILAQSSAPSRITDLAEQVHALTDETRDVAGAWDTRAATYARFVSTCAACHQATGAGAPPS